MMKSSFKQIVASACSFPEGCSRRAAFPFGQWFVRFGRTSALAACLMTAAPPYATWAAPPHPLAEASQQSEIGLLIDGLKSRDVQTRKNAVQDLTWMGEAAKPAVPLLLKCLNDHDPLVRATAARAVWEIDRRAGDAVPVLVALLKSRDNSHRELAAYFLGPMGEAAEPAVPALRTAIADENAGVRIHAAEALAQIDPAGTEAVEVLLKAIKHPKADVRSLAAMAFNNVAPIHAEKVVPVLMAALNDPDPGVKASLELSLTHFNLDVARSDQAFPGNPANHSPVIVKAAPLAPTAENTTPFASPNQMAQVSGMSAELEKAVHDLSSTEAAVRKNALERIGWMGRAAEPALADVAMCLQDPQPEIRANAAKTLFDIDPQSALAAVNTLRDMLDSTLPGVRPLAAFYLGYIGPQAASALPTLKRALASADGVEQLQIAESVIRINPEDAEAVTVLIGGLRAPESQVRFQAAYALGAASPVHAERIVPELAAAMRDQSPHVRQAAELALNSFPPESLPAPIVAIQPRQAEGSTSSQHAPADVVIQPRPLAPAVGKQDKPVLPAAPVEVAEVEPIPEAPMIGEEEQPIADPVVQEAQPFPATSALIVEEIQPPPAAPLIVEEIQPSPAAPLMVQTIEPIPAAPVSIETLQPAESPQVAILEAEPMVPLPMPIAPFEETLPPAEPIWSADSGTLTQSPENRLGLGEDYKPIGSVGVSIAPKRRDEDGKLLPLPTNYGAAWLQEVGSLHQPTGESRPWAIQSVQYAASAFCHRPLYFEEINLERYGHNFGHCIQPFVSGVAFFGRAPLLPYMMVAESPHECQYTLGHYRPGNCVPFRPSHLPWSTTGALVQGGIITGLFFAIY